MSSTDSPSYTTQAQTSTPTQKQSCATLKVGIRRRIDTEVKSADKVSSSAAASTSSAACPRPLFTREELASQLAKRAEWIRQEQVEREAIRQAYSRKQQQQGNIALAVTLLLFALLCLMIAVFVYQAISSGHSRADLQPTIYDAFKQSKPTQRRFRT